MTLNQYIDHTVLKANAVEDDIRQLCAEAREHRRHRFKNCNLVHSSSPCSTVRP